VPRRFEASTLNFHNIPKPHRFKNAAMLILNVDSVVEVCPAFVPDRFREGETGLLAGKLARPIQVGKLSSIFVARIDVVVKMEVISWHNMPSAN